MKSDPLDVLNAITLSKATVRKMKQTLRTVDVRLGRSFCPRPPGPSRPGPSRPSSRVAAANKNVTTAPGFDSLPKTPTRIGVAADHGGYDLKEQLARLLRDAGYDVIDFGDNTRTPDDDYPDFVVPLARAVVRREIDRGVAICGSGVGACVVANKVPGVRACLIHETFSARQGVEDDDLNVICLGGLVVGPALAWELVKTFLASRFSGAERHRRRLAKVSEVENGRPSQASGLKQR